MFLLVKRIKLFKKITEKSVFLGLRFTFTTKPFSDFDNMSSHRKICEILKANLNDFISKLRNMLRHIKKLTFSLAVKWLNMIEIKHHTECECKETKIKVLVRFIPTEIFSHFPTELKSNALPS